MELLAANAAGKFMAHLIVLDFNAIMLMGDEGGVGGESEVGVGDKHHCK